jgi:hypothetical protein
MTRHDVLDAFFHVTRGRVPVQMFTDRVYVSIDAMPLLVINLSPEFGYVVRPDPELRGLEMRFEYDARSMTA